jgi:hypothetical protein
MGVAAISTRVGAEGNPLFTLKTYRNDEKSTMIQQNTDLVPISCFSSDTCETHTALTETILTCYLYACCTPRIRRSGREQSCTRSAHRSNFPTYCRSSSECSSAKTTVVAVRATPERLHRRPVGRKTLDVIVRRGRDHHTTPETSGDAGNQGIGAARSGGSP